MQIGQGGEYVLIEDFASDDLENCHHSSLYQRRASVFPKSGKYPKTWVSNISLDREELRATICFDLADYDSVLRRTIQPQRMAYVMHTAENDTFS